MKCQKCGYLLTNSDRTCPMCGTPVLNNQSVQTPPSMFNQQSNGGDNNVSANGLQIGAFTRNNVQKKPLINLDGFPTKSL